MVQRGRLRRNRLRKKEAKRAGFAQFSDVVGVFIDHSLQRDQLTFQGVIPVVRRLCKSMQRLVDDRLKTLFIQAMGGEWSPPTQEASHKRLRLPFSRSVSAQMEKEGKHAAVVANTHDSCLAATCVRTLLMPGAPPEHLHAVKGGQHELKLGFISIERALFWMFGPNGLCREPRFTWNKPVRTRCDNMRLQLDGRLLYIANMPSLDSVKGDIIAHIWTSAFAPGACADPFVVRLLGKDIITGLVQARVLKHLHYRSVEWMADMPMLLVTGKSVRYKCKPNINESKIFLANMLRVLSDEQRLNVHMFPGERGPLSQRPARLTWLFPNAIDADIVMLEGIGGVVDRLSVIVNRLKNIWPRKVKALQLWNVLANLKKAQ